MVVEADGLPLRMLAFPVDEGAYERIAGARGRAVFSRFPVRGIRPGEREPDGSEGELLAYDFEQQRGATLASEIDDFVLGPDARTLVYASHGKLRAIDAGADLPEEGDDDKPPAEAGRRSGWLDLSRVSVPVEPPRRVGADAARSLAPAARELLGPADERDRLGRGAASATPRCCRGCAPAASSRT